MYFARVRMNLPGSLGYDPRQPWVSKVRKTDGRIAADVVTFLDDARPSGPSKRESWQAAIKRASTLSNLGLQDAPQKRRDSSQTPGAWAGSVVQTNDGGVYVLLPQAKWDKLKVLVKELQEMMVTNAKRLNWKRLEQIRGFLIHVVSHDEALFNSASHDN
jgi:hypothetical protein